MLWSGLKEKPQDGCFFPSTRGAQVQDQYTMARRALTLIKKKKKNDRASNKDLQLGDGGRWGGERT